MKTNKRKFAKLIQSSKRLCGRERHKRGCRTEVDRKKISDNRCRQYGTKIDKDRFGGFGPSDGLFCFGCDFFFF